MKKVSVMAAPLLLVAAMAAWQLGLGRSCADEKSQKANADAKSAKQDRAGGASKSGAPRPVLVTSAVAVAKPVPVLLDTFGTVTAFSTVTVKPQVNGMLTKVHFQKGQSVKKGDMLFTIDPRPFQVALKSAEANLARNQVLEANARKDAQRESVLLEKNVSTQSDYERIVANADALAATVRANQAAVENAKLQLAYCEIRSPLDGRVGDPMVDEGNIVKENETALVTINQISPVDVFFSVPQQELPIIRQGMAKGKLTVRAALPKEDGAPEAGVLTFVDNTVETSTGTIRLGATFENKNERLWPGQYVHVSLALRTIEKAVVIPAPAIQTGRDGKYVFVILADQSVEMRMVQVGFKAGEEAAIEKGIQPGERVVTDGQMQLATGRKVEERPSAAAR